MDVREAKEWCDLGFVVSVLLSSGSVLEEKAFAGKVFKIHY